MPPSIVILSTFATPFRSGAEACAEEVSALLQGRYAFTIITARLRRSLPKIETLPSGVVIRRVGLGMKLDKWFYPFLAPFVARACKPQIVHAILESYAGVALLITRWLCPGVQRLLTLQSTNTRFLLGPIHHSAQRITAISSVLIERARTYGRTDVTHIPNGLHYQKMQQACQEYQKIPGRLLFVGRLEPMKGVDTLITVFSTIAPLFPEAQLHIVGDGTLRTRLSHSSIRSGLQSRIFFRGYLTPLAVLREYAEAQIFCGLSRSEAMGNVFLEAQAAGCAVVGTTTGGIPEVVADGEAGILVPPDTAAQAAEAIITLLRDPNRLQQMAATAREHARMYDWCGIAERYAGVYGEMLGQAEGNTIGIWKTERVRQL